MMKVKRNKLDKKIIVALILAAVSSICLGTGVSLMSTNAFAASDKLENITISMSEGAGVRATPNYKDNGIRYRLNVPATEYDEFIKDNADSSFGFFIAPVDYDEENPLNMDNLVGANAVYTWQGDNYDETKIEIINLNTTTLSLDAETGERYWYGSIVNLKYDENGEWDNRDREFIAVAYIKDGEDYKFAERNDNVRSMVYVAQCALQSGKYDNDAVLTKALTDSYITPFADKEVNYTVETVYDDGEKIVTETATYTKKINETISVTPQASIEKDGLVYTTENTQVDTVAYANNKTKISIRYGVAAKYTADFKGVALNADGSVGSGNIVVRNERRYSGANDNPATINSSERGLVLGGVGAYEGPSVNLNGLNKETSYTLNMSLIGKELAGVAGIYAYLYYTDKDGNVVGEGYKSNGTAKNTYAADLASNFFQPSADGTRAYFTFTTPNVEFHTAKIALLSPYGGAWSVTIPEMSVIERTINHNMSYMTSGKVGATYQMQVDTAICAGKPTYSSSDSTVASVDANGLVTLNKSGKAEITVTVGSYTKKAYFVAYNADGTYIVSSNNATLVYDENSPSDYVIDVAEGKQLKVLQISDPQIMDVTQLRSETRISTTEKKFWANRDDAVYNKLAKTIEATKPDLILVAGDIIYGEFDDDGTMLEEFIEFMDSKKIYWAPIYGNHDNETAKGSAWQNAQYMQSTYCLFNRGVTMGNSNYTISVKQGETWLSNIYMLDTNGNSASLNGENRALGLYSDTVEWLKSKDAAIKTYQNVETKDFVCMHITTQGFYAIKGLSGTNLNINLDNDGDDTTFGHIITTAGYASETSDYPYDGTYGGVSTHEVFKSLGITNVSAGHCHVANSSIVNDGIRYTFGLKAGTMPDNTIGETGGTVFELTADGYSAYHYYDNYADNTITGVALSPNTGTYVHTAKIVEVEGGFRSVYYNTTGGVNFEQIYYSTALKTEIGKLYSYTITLRTNELLGEFALSNINIQMEGGSIVNNWTKVGEGVYTITSTFTAASKNPYLWVAFNYNADGKAGSGKDYGYDIELCNLTAKSQYNDYSNLTGGSNITVEESADGSATMSVAENFSGFAGKRVTSKEITLVADKVYVASYKLTGITDTTLLNYLHTNINNTISGYVQLSSCIGVQQKILNDTTIFGITEIEGGYIISCTFKAFNSGSYYFDMAVNDAAWAGYSFTISDITVSESDYEFFTTKSQGSLSVSLLADNSLSVKLTQTVEWYTLDITTNYVLAAGTTYTITYDIIDVKDFATNGAGLHYQFNGDGWKNCKSKATAIDGGYRITTTVTGADAALAFSFAVNTSSTGAFSCNITNLTVTAQ